MLFVCPELIVFLRIFVVGTKGKNTARSAAPNRACYDKNAEASLQAALHERQQQAIAAGGIVAVEAIHDSGETARREQCSNRKANMACKTAQGRLDLSEHLRKESEAAAETAENDSCKSQAALHASETALRAAEAALRALYSPRRSSDRSSFLIAVLRATFAFVCSSSIALVSLSHRSVANSFLYGDATGRIGPRYGLLLVVAEHVGCCCCCCCCCLVAAVVAGRRSGDVGCCCCCDASRAHL